MLIGIVKGLGWVLKGGVKLLGVGWKVLKWGGTTVAQLLYEMKGCLGKVRAKEVVSLLDDKKRIIIAKDLKEALYITRKAKTADELYDGRKAAQAVESAWVKAGIDPKGAAEIRRIIMPDGTITEFAGKESLILKMMKSPAAVTFASYAGKGVYYGSLTYAVIFTTAGILTGRWLSLRGHILYLINGVKDAVVDPHKRSSKLILEEIEQIRELLVEYQNKLQVDFMAFDTILKEMVSDKVFQEYLTREFIENTDKWTNVCRATFTKEEYDNLKLDYRKLAEAEFPRENRHTHNLHAKRCMVGVGLAIHIMDVAVGEATDDTPALKAFMNSLGSKDGAKKADEAMDRLHDIILILEGKPGRK